MAAQKRENKTVRRRLASSWISTVISIALVLVLVGAAALVLLNARAVSDYFKENVKVSVIMAEEAAEPDVLAYQQVLDSLPFVRSTEFISREAGIREMAEMLGEDFMDAFVSAPVPMSIDLSLEAEYVAPDSLKRVSSVVSASPLVEEVVYQESLVDSLNANLGKLSIIVLALIAVLVFISVVLIGNTVRLSVFSKRFSVHTMRLVGATKGFIRRPFVGQSVLQGFVAALLALAILAGGLWLLNREFPGAAGLFPPELLGITAGIVLLTGIILCAVSSAIVVGHMVDMDKEELYS